MAEQVAFINVRAVWLRVLLVIPAALALLGAWHGVRWCAGATLAESAQDLDAAESAARLAPDNPFSHLRLARLRRVSFLPEELPAALREYERAAALAPHDYIVWTEFGRARGEMGDAEGGIQALRRAVELAPSYSLPRWHLGNALLRAGRTDEAFAELRRAADADPLLRPQVFNLAWQVYAQDIPRVVEAVGRTPEARAQLILVLVGRGLLDDALKVWAGLGAGDRTAHAGAGETLARALHDRRRYRQSLRVLEEAGLAGDVAPEKMSNPGFESEIGQAGKQLFRWQIIPVSAGVRVALDSRGARAGGRSLLVLFSAATQVDFTNAAQLVAVEPGAHYRLSFYFRTEDLKSAAMPLTQVIDTSAETPAVLASTPPVPQGTSEWQQVSLEFAAGPRTEAVVVHMTRPGCPDGVCPIFGKIWYDDFDLQRTGGPARAR